MSESRSRRSKDRPRDRSKELMPADPVQVQLTGRATRFVHLLVDLGHLDQETANRVLVGVTELVQGRRVADIADVRRAAAMVLFPVDEQSPFDGVLAEDWPILFS